MASDTNPTFEEVDKLIQAADLSKFQPGGAHHLEAPAAAASPAAALPNICAAYKIIKPILQLILNTPFLPSKWKDAIRAFMNVIGVICP